MWSWINPRKTPGLRWHDLAPYTLIAVLLLILNGASFALGTQVEKHRLAHQDSATYVQKHFKADLQEPTFVETLKAPIPPRVSLVSGNFGVNLTYYPAVGNQGEEGACSGWATMWALSYIVRVNSLRGPPALRHPGIKFNPCYAYDYCADESDGGQDGGCWPPADLDVVRLHGAAQYKTLPCPSPIAYPFPSPSDPNLSSQWRAVFANAARFPMPNVQMATLYQGNPSDAVYQEIVAVLSTGAPAVIAINVTPSFDAVGANGVISYAGQEGNRGGHAITALRVLTNTLAPDGSPEVEIQNQWTKYWGVNGRAYLSEKWLAANAWAVWRIDGVPTPGGGS